MSEKIQSNYNSEDASCLIFDALTMSQAKQEEFKKIFYAQLEPLYGSQLEALRKVFFVGDRTAKVILNNDDEIAGILVHKNYLVSEYGIDNALEIKTLMLVDTQKNGGKGYGTALAREADNVANNMGATSIFVTVASDKQESHEFFVKHGYAPHIHLNGAYRTGNVETIYKKEVYDDTI
jgi:hypothetical protein